MKTLYKVSIALQLAYCLGCCVVFICLPLHSIYYESFGATLLLIGYLFGVGSMISPLGLVGYGLHLAAFLSTDLKKSKRALLLAIVAPIVIVLCWLLVIYTCATYITGPIV